MIFELDEEGRRDFASEPVVCFAESIMFLKVTSRFRRVASRVYIGHSLDLEPRGERRFLVAEIDGLFQSTNARPGNEEG